MKRAIGWLEWVVLPMLHPDPIKAKIDTGARTSALHAARIRPLQVDGEDCVEFELDRSDLPSAACPFRLPVLGRKTVRNSGGRAEERFLVETALRIGGDEWPVEFTLAARHEMNFPILIGRTALRRRFVVDAGRTYLITSREAMEQPDQEREGGQ